MLHDIRKQYEFSTLVEKNAFTNPFEQFNVWLHEAISGSNSEPTAMVLSTVDEKLQPHSRVVLLKELSQVGFIFYTNYEGNKAKQMLNNNQVALLFFWPEFERQVRITGIVEKVSEKLSTDYFKSRPLESRLGAWASPQSTIIPSSEFLEERFQFYSRKFGMNVPKPPYWGGYIVKPETFEFWQGRPNRLHDRLYFVFEASEWKVSRLAP